MMVLIIDKNYKDINFL